MQNVSLSWPKLFLQCVLCLCSVPWYWMESWLAKVMQCGFQGQVIKRKVSIWLLLKHLLLEISQHIVRKPKSHIESPYVDVWLTVESEVNYHTCVLMSLSNCAPRHCGKETSCSHCVCSEFLTHRIHEHDKIMVLLPH